MAKLGSAYVDIRANLKPLRAGLKLARKTVATAMGGITSVIKGSAVMIKKALSGILKAVKWVTIALLGIGVASVKMAMDAIESENLFEVSMKSMADSTRKWSKEISNSMGLNSFEVRKMVSTFNVMLKSMGLGAGEAAEMSKQMTQLAFDMASFYNLKPDEAFQKIQAGITGEIEPLKRLGILINETATKTWAVNKGFVQQKGVMTDLQKVVARYNLLFEQTKDAQGDMKRTLDSPANVFRTIKSLMMEISIEIGKSLLPAVTKMAIKFRDFLKNNKINIAEWSELFVSKITFVKDVMWDLIKWLSGDWITNIESILSATLPLFEGLGSGIKNIFEKIWADIKRISKNALVEMGGDFVYAKARWLNWMGGKERAKRIARMERSNFIADSGTTQGGGKSFGDVNKENAKIMSDALKKAFGALPDEVKGILEKTYKEMTDRELEIKERYEKMKAEAEISGSGGGGAKVSFPSAGGGGNGIGGKVGFAGLKEAYRSFAESLTKKKDPTTKATEDVKKEVEKGNKIMSGGFQSLIQQGGGVGIFT